MFSGGNKNGVQQGQPQNGGGQTTQQDGGAQQQKEAADPGIDKIKQYLNDNDDISDWPADRLGACLQLWYGGKPWRCEGTHYRRVYQL